jgi:LCP family protein required for cell wall assembly
MPKTDYTVYRAAGYAPPRAPQRRPQRRRWVGLLRWVGLVLVAAVCLSGGLAFGFLQGSLGRVKHNSAAVVKVARPELSPVTSGTSVNILVMGSDRRLGEEADKGRSDTMMLVRLDPNTKCISMLSVPRDLYIDIPGVGKERINVAYTVGGPKLTIQVFKQLTGLPINHFIDVNFVGFVRIVDKLGGVYIDVDRRYYNPLNTGWAAIDLQPGYQKLTGRQALSFVRFRHDATGDFMRMQRQQYFLHEVQRQAKRWSNWTKVPGIVKAVSENTITDISDTGTFLSMARLVLGLNTSQVFQSHLVAPPSMVNGASVLLAQPQDIKRAVDDFLDPRQAPARAQLTKIPRDAFPVRVLNGSGAANIAATVSAQLVDQGFSATAAGNADSFDYGGSVVFAQPDLQAQAKAIANLVRPASVRVIRRYPGTLPGITVVVGQRYTGASEPQNTNALQRQIVLHAPQNVAAWQALSARTPLKLVMPTVWSPGMSYDATSWRAYTVPTTGAGNRAAVCVVGTTAAGGYWHIEETSWTSPPLLSDPNDTRTVNGRQYMLFYQNDRLHRVAWKANGALYWVANTLDDQLSNELMLALATSCKRVQ